MPVGITSHLAEQLCLSLQETYKIYLPMGRCKIHNDMFMQLHCTCIYVDALIIFHISCFNTIRVSLMSSFCMVDPSLQDLVRRILPLCCNYSTVVRFIEGKMCILQGQVSLNVLCFALKIRFIAERRLGGQQVNHRMYLKCLVIICLAINYLVEKNSIYRTLESLEFMLAKFSWCS